MNLVRDNRVLKVGAHHFNGLVPTAFILCSPDYPLQYTKDYIDIMASRGAKGFRAALNIYWGPDYSGSHGGNTVFFGNDALKVRIREIVEYLDSKDMCLFLEILDASIFIHIGDAYYDQGGIWIELLEYITSLNHDFGNLVIGTGNEPAKIPGGNQFAIASWHNWVIDELKNRAAAIGDAIIIAAEINRGTGVPQLKNKASLDILSFKTPRWDDASIIQETYNRLLELRASNYNKVIWGQEPPRRNYPGMGQYCSSVHKTWLKKIMFSHIGMLYTPHGLGSGEEDHKPIDWGGDGMMFWGMGEHDWWDLYKGFNRTIDRFRRPPAGPSSKVVYDFLPDSSFVDSSGLGFRSPQNDIYIVVPIGTNTTVTIPSIGRCKVDLINMDTGDARKSTFETSPSNYDTTNDSNELIIVRKAVSTRVKDN